MNEGLELEKFIEKIYQSVSPNLVRVLRRKNRKEKIKSLFNEH